MKRFALLLSVIAAACGESHDDEDATPPDAANEDARPDGREDGRGPDATMNDAAPDAAPPRNCAKPSDCILTSRSCCGQCGTATREDSVAIRADAANAYREGVCGEDVGCPGCFAQQDPTLIATCVAGNCEVVDLRTDSVSTCNTDSQCRVRASECCECGASTDPQHLIAISSTSGGRIETLLCDPEFGCPECAPVYPDNVRAECGMDGHCQAVVLE